MTSDFFRSVVIATDGSENTRRAIFYGIQFAKAQSLTAGKEMMYEILKMEGREAISKVKECGAASGVDVKEVLLEGHPGKEIIDFAVNNGIDLIVMGTLGRTGIDRFLMGSVAEKVVRNSKVPVMVVRSEEQS